MIRFSKTRKMTLLVTASVVLVVVLVITPTIQRDVQKYRLSQAAATGHVEEVREIIDRGIDNKTLQQTFGIALVRGEPDVVGLLLDRGADIKSSPKTDWPVVRVAINSIWNMGNKDPHKVARTVEVLLSHGANANECDLYGESALILAVAMKLDEVVYVLLKHGAKVNYNQPSCGSALFAATRGGSTKTVKMLLEAGADPSIPNARSQLPLDVARACSDFQMVKVFETWIPRTTKTNFAR